MTSSATVNEGSVIVQSMVVGAAAVSQL